MYGYMGRILRVNLTDGVVRTEDLDEQSATRFLGGRGLAAKVLWDEMEPGIDPLEPGNVFVVATGPFAGTAMPAGSRFVIMAKSPLTGLLGDAEIGGYFGHYLKKAGYDAVVFEGRAKSPKYLAILDGEACLRDASDLWGKSVADTVTDIRETEGKTTRVLAIGPAGEALVRYANVMSEAKYAGGRSGMGAVMGSKHLKAIAVSGHAEVQVADPEEFGRLRRGLVKDLKENASAQHLGRYGTWNTMAGVTGNGILPTKNFETGVFDRAEEIDGDALMEALLDGRETCYGCPIRCRRVIKPVDEHSGTDVYGGPQYEAVAALGSLCMNADPVAIAVANALCNAYGMDVISAGACIAFAMECVERKALTAEDIGFDLRWGDPDAVIRLVHMIGERQGIGNLLAEGVKRASEQIGKGSEAWAMHVKGMEVAMHDPRGKKGVGLSMATCHRGPDHMECLHDEAFERGNGFPDLGLVEPMSRMATEGKPRMVKVTQDYWGVLGDCVCVCKFPMGPGRPLTPKLLTAILNAITGWDLTLDELLTAGERVFNLCRMLIVREGASRKDDTLPERFGKPMPAGPTAGETVTATELQSMLDEYYRLRGWSNEGVPLKETLDRLGLLDLLAEG
jgi:aldehyde:ferredoxin oxidoreductase